MRCVPGRGGACSPLPALERPLLGEVFHADDVSGGAVPVEEDLLLQVPLDHLLLLVPHCRGVEQEEIDGPAEAVGEAEAERPEDLQDLLESDVGHSGGELYLRSQYLQAILMNLKGTYGLNN